MTRFAQAIEGAQGNGTPCLPGTSHSPLFAALQAQQHTDGLETASVLASALQKAQDKHGDSRLDQTVQRLSALVELCELGVNAEALAESVRGLQREANRLQDRGESDSCSAAPPWLP